MMKVLTHAGDRHAKWLVFVAWLLFIFVTVGPLQLPTKFADAEKNESSSFLPGDAESTKALEITDRLQGGETAPIVAVWRRASGLTPADRQTIAAAIERFNAERARRAAGSDATAAEPFKRTQDLGDPELSADGAAAIATGNITGNGESETILDPVDLAREIITDPGGGLEAKVTGPAGFSADAIKVFEGINGTLLAAAGGLVFILLILIYRSPLFFWIPLFAVIFAELATRAIGYALTEVGVTVNGQSSSILSVLVLGAGTDYALLLVARYREELRKHQDKHEAIQLALRTAGPAILASGFTVVLALLCLTVAKVNGTAGLGPIGALGIAVAMVTMLTLLPAMLTIFGRKAFWPFIPDGPDGRDAPDAPPSVPQNSAARALDAVGHGIRKATAPLRFVLRNGWRGAMAPLRPILNWAERKGHDWVEGHSADETHGLFRRIGERVAKRPRTVWIATAALLAVLALGLLNVSNNLTTADSYTEEVEAQTGQKLLAQSFPGGANAPTDVVVADSSKTAAVIESVKAVEGVADVYPAPGLEPGPDGTVLSAVLEPDPYTVEAFALIDDIRAAAKRAGGPGTVVGGASAIEQDLRDAADRDTKLIVPLALIVVFLVLMALLRAVTISLLLIGTVVLSFAASLGVGAIVFDVIFGFPGSDPSLPLFAFVFLVALGIDYNIFLMARVREETQRHGTRDGMLRGLAVTGGVITSAGIVLAGTFAVLGVLPLVFLTEIGFVVAFGVLLDTFLVRSVLVPALVLHAGPKVWWPSRLATAETGLGSDPAPT